MRVKQKLCYAVWVLLLTVGFQGAAIAQYSSSNYKVEETQFGTGGNVDTNSANYNARQSAGSLGVGNVSSTNYDAYAGFVTPSEPFLEMVVMNASVDFGALNPNAYSYGAARAGACNCSFYVRTYQSSSYTVVTASGTPTSESGFSLAPKTTQGVPSASNSVEEFGINLVANTTPNIGADPRNLADNSFADGQAAPGYDTPDQFKYNQGDTIARSAATTGNQAVGVTEYTISYIAKPNQVTRAGLYKLNHDIVVVPTY